MFITSLVTRPQVFVFLVFFPKNQKTKWPRDKASSSQLESSITGVALCSNASVRISSPNHVYLVFTCQRVLASPYTVHFYLVIFFGQFKDIFIESIIIQLSILLCPSFFHGRIYSNETQISKILYPSERKLNVVFSYLVNKILLSFLPTYQSLSNS